MATERFIPVDRSEGSRSRISFTRPFRAGHRQSEGSVLRPGRASRASGNATFSPDGQRVEECAVLKDHGDFLADDLELRFVVVGDVFAGHDHPARVRLQKSHDVMERDRFAHTAAAEDADRLPGLDIEADVVEDAVVSKGLGDVFEFDVERTCLLLPPSGLAAPARLPDDKCRRARCAQTRRADAASSTARRQSSGVFTLRNMLTVKPRARQSFSSTARTLIEGKAHRSCSSCSARAACAWDANSRR